MEKPFNKKTLCSMAQLQDLKSGNADFGAALLALKSGCQVARSGWNGKGMYLRYTEPYVHFQLSEKQVEDHIGDATLLPWIGMKTANNCFVPWLASQTDLLAYDWTIIV